MIRLRFTALWFLFGPVLGCMWMAAVNYSNNLVYAVLYLIGALSFVSIFHTWRNVAAVEVAHVRVKAAFAGEEIEVGIDLRHRRGPASHNLVFQRIDARGSTTLRLRKGARLEPGDAATVTAFLPALPRGRYQFDRLVVRSAYPFGLFWALRRVPVRCVHYVYPVPRGEAVLPARSSAGAEGMPHRAGDDFSGVRSYSPGESLRHVDWKAYARGRPLMVKQFTGGEGRELWLEARSLARLPLEARLSQLARWALQAEEEDAPYGLSLEEIRLPPDRGPQHQRRILEALAAVRPQASAGPEETVHRSRSRA